MTQKILDNDERKNKLRKEFRIAIAAWIIFGIILCVGIFVIIYGARPELFRDKSLVPTNATVIGYEEKYINNSALGTYYFPIYFYEYEGEEYTITGDTSVNPAPFATGEEITIYVNPAAPTDIVAPIGNKFFIIFGCCVLVLSIFALVISSYGLFEEMFPKSNWPKFVFRNIPIMLFPWFCTILLAVSASKPLSNDMLMLIIVFGAFSTFMTAIMVHAAIEEFRY